MLIDFKRDYKQLVEFMKKDKKNSDSLISFVLPVEFGDCKEIKIKDKELLSVLDRVGELI